MKAGLGGGSSNAAATLWGLRRLWKLRLPDEQIHELAARRAPTCPSSSRGTALGLGRGDELYPLEHLPRYWVVLAIPPFGVATADAYRWFDESQKGLAGVSRAALGKTLPTPFPLFPCVQPVNDLEPPVVLRYPLIGQLKQRLTDEGALVAAMSGSGSTVFGVFTSAGAARAAARAV